MLFRNRRYFRTKSTVCSPVQLRHVLSEVDFVFRKCRKIIAAFYVCLNLRLLISNANSDEVRVWWQPALWLVWDFVAYASSYVVIKHEPQQYLRYWSDFGGKNSDEKPRDFSFTSWKRKKTLDKKRRSCTGVNTAPSLRNTSKCEITSDKRYSNKKPFHRNTLWFD